MRVASASPNSSPMHLVAPAPKGRQDARSSGDGASQRDGNLVGQLRGGQGLALLVAGRKHPGHQVVAVFGSGAGLLAAVDELADLTAPNCATS
jgi:hypothetical protein